MIRRGLHTRARKEAKGWKSVAWVSTPVYDGQTMIGRDMKDGWFRTFFKNGEFYYHGENANGPFDGGPCKTRAAAARLAAKMFYAAETSRS